MQTFRKQMAVALAIAAFAAPIAASAETTATTGLSADVQAQVQALLSQIKTLQEQIKTLVGSSTMGQGWKMGSTTGSWNPGQNGKMGCVSIVRNLKQGDSGEDVKNLQQMLRDDSSSGFNGSITGFFGPLTMKAMRMFQMNNGISSSTDGTVGPLTRGFFERRCGNGMSNNQGQGGPMGKMPGMMGGSVRGSIAAVSASGITVTTDGGSTVVNVSASTTIKVFSGTSTPPTAGTMADLTVGKKVAAMGPKNTDGSIQAMDIVIGENLPMMKGGMGEMMDDKGGMRPMGMMPTTNGPQHGPGTNGGPQNW